MPAMRKLTHDHGLLGGLWCALVPCHEELKRMVAQEVARAREKDSAALRAALADPVRRRALAGPEAEEYGSRRDYLADNLRWARAQAEEQGRMNRQSAATRALLGDGYVRREPRNAPVVGD